MASMSIRGIDQQILLRLKDQAKQERISLNSLMLRLLQGGGSVQQPTAVAKFDDIDALAGTWSEQEALDFAHQTAAFAEVDEALWR